MLVDDLSLWKAQQPGHMGLLIGPNSAPKQDNWMECLCGQRTLKPHPETLNKIHVLTGPKKRIAVDLPTGVQGAEIWKI